MRTRRAIIAMAIASVVTMPAVAQKYYARQSIQPGPGAPVDDIPDKSEYVTNGTFAAKSGWTLLGGATYGTNLVSVGSTVGRGVSQQIDGLKPGATYTLTFHMHCTASASDIVGYTYSIGTQTGSGSKANVTPSVQFVATSGSMPLTIKTTISGHGYILSGISIVKN